MLSSDGEIAKGRITGGRALTNEGGPAVLKEPPEVVPDTECHRQGTLGSGRTGFDPGPHSLLTVIGGSLLTSVGLTPRTCSDGAKTLEAGVRDRQGTEGGSAHSGLLLRCPHGQVGPPPLGPPLTLAHPVCSRQQNFKCLSHKGCFVMRRQWTQ